MMFQPCFLAVERKPRMVAKSTALETQYMQVQLARAVPVQSRPRITPQVILSGDLKLICSGQARKTLQTLR